MDDEERARVFSETYGHSADVSWVAPGRVNLIGEYTDVNEGFVLPFAIPQVTTVEASSRADRVLYLRSLQDSPSAGVTETELDGGAAPQIWAMYPVAMARALEASGYRMGGAEFLVDTDIPIGAGLSSSAALECAVGSALCALYGAELPPMELARVAQRAENEFVGAPTGIMDQAAAMCCTAGHALFLDTRSLGSRQVPFDLTGAGLGLLVVDTRVKHAVAESAYADRRRSCEAAARALGVPSLRDVPSDQAEEALVRLAALGEAELVRRARHVLTEQDRVLEVAALLDSGKLGAIGPVLVAGHRSLRDDFEVSCAELDAVVDVAMAAGALGARMTGAGFGGSAIVLAEERALPVVEAAVGKAFVGNGWVEPRCFAVQASAGARQAAKP